MLVGKVDDLPDALTKLSTTGLLKSEPPLIVERWIDAACGAGLIALSPDKYQTLRLTPLGRDVMSGRVEDVVMTVPTLRDKAPRKRAKGRRRRIR